MITLLITSGRGPVECRMAVAHVLDAMAREAAEAGVGCDGVRGVDPDGRGPASALVILSGDRAAELARCWIGTILWVAPSEVRPGHKRKNWYVGVIAQSEAPTQRAPLTASDVRFEAFAAGGAGGQHQNKTESAVRAVHVPTGLAVVVREERSQHRNKALALARLAALIRGMSELDALVAQQQLHAGHALVQRGQPERGQLVRRFVGVGFQER
jgi:peptide chain release factor